MNRFLDLDILRDEMKDPYPAGRMTPAELGDTVARLVWESFSDYLIDPDVQSLLAGIGIPIEEGLPQERAVAELLIFHMWAHSRAIQLSFFRRVPDETVRAVLDHLHRAVFEDMIANGTPEPQVPLFEQRVSARYAAFYAAANVSDERVGAVALDHLVEGRPEGATAVVKHLTERAVELSNPLRDFLEGVDLVAADD